MRYFQKGMVCLYEEIKTVFIWPNLGLSSPPLTLKHKTPNRYDVNDVGMNFRTLLCKSDLFFSFGHRNIVPKENKLVTGLKS